METKSSSSAVKLGFAALILYILKPTWFDSSLLGLIVIAATVILTTTCILALCISRFKPSLFPITSEALFRNTGAAVLFALVSIKLEEVFPIYAGLVLGLVLFAAAMLFPRKKFSA